MKDDFGSIHDTPEFSLRGELFSHDQNISWLIIHFPRSYAEG
jgi:hypothetical protein